ncbi:UDP-glucose 4-epimerase [Geoanaerobacter pelophilus]|uniref:UDP-glucose 4-epimerase n=1 Tax=Geoanaerobacter pelophilus TaxID=60036 RepID=A0ABQ0MKE3_9BACT|nr:UDP-glucose 4-epimerase [Geoanaerobacter pelophilus]
MVRQLSEAGHEVIVFDNLSTGSADALINGERLIVGDLSDERKIGEVLRETGAKSVLHFAAAIVAPESVQLPLKYYSNNTRNTLNLIKACVDNKVERFIFSSTAAVYGIPEGGRAAEESPTVPINPYGTSKLMSEWMLRDAAFAHGFSYVALRYFNVAGADPQARMGQRTPDATHLIKVACQAALGMRDSVSIFGTDYDTPDGTGIRDYIHIEDLAAAHLYALKYLEKGGASSTINVGYGQGGSVREVIKVVKEVSGVDFKVVEGPRRPGDPADLVAVADRIRTVLGWTPRYNDLRTIIEDAWRWEKKLFEKQK